MNPFGQPTHEPNANRIAFWVASAASNYSSRPKIELSST